MENCIFCQIAEKRLPAEIVYEDQNFMAFLDIRPLSKGHLQLIPKKHVFWVYEIEDIGQFFILAKKIIRVIIRTLGADHVTMATYGHKVRHAHLWIVPQYKQEVDIEEYSGLNIEKNKLHSIAGRLKGAIGREVS